MYRLGDRILVSATDLVTFHECEHASALDRAALDDAALRAERCAADETGQLMQRRGNEFEAAWLAELRQRHAATPGAVVEIAKDWRDPQAAVAATLAAMRAGAEVIYQATFLHDDLLGHVDFLHKVPGHTAFGPWGYEVTDTKLGKRPKASWVVQLAFYAELVGRAQQAEPRQMRLVLGSRETVAYRCADHLRYLRRLLDRFRARAGVGPEASYPTPCARCEYCHWRERCEARRTRDDSLWLVAGMRASQVQKLQEAGVQSLAALGNLPDDARVPHLAPESLQKLRAQAAMQLEGRLRGELRHRLLPPSPEAARGLAALPKPDVGDVYFDMEGDPIYVAPGASAGDGGLEYLFGALFRDESGEWQFRAFWGHGRAQERAAFESFMDWLEARLARHPGLHVYHYAPYEDSALKRLAARHASREVFLDRLLRESRLVDLYRVTRESILASTASYSLKDIEKFYRGARAGDVQTAGASIVAYERYLETGDAQLLEDIERYNEDDVRSLQELHLWLLSQRPTTLPWRGADEAPDGGATAAQPSERLQAYLADVAEVRRALLAGVPEDPLQRTERGHARALLADLLEFHRRCEKPQWWEMFARVEASFDELLDSVDAIAGLQRVAGGAAGEYEYPPQEIRFEGETGAVWLEHPRQVQLRILELDEERRRVLLAPTRSSGALPETLNLGKRGPLDAEVLKQALLRVGRSVAANEGRYAALEALLEKRLPTLAGRAPGEPLLRDPAAPVADVVDAVARLESSYLYVQGPPGAGKTYTASHVIVALLLAGKRVAVSSNSHKAINNLLGAVEALVLERHGEAKRLRACKKIARGKDDQAVGGIWILDTDDTAEALSPQWNLVGGTAWLFAHADADQQFDYLFVDEAGQVSLGHLAAMAACARNLVLLGDQMQLSQPIQGVHPGCSGQSTLDYLLDGAATVPPERGIFLPTTWRMCPDVCRFISDAIYDGRLEPEPRNANQRLVLPAAGVHPALRPTGVVFWPVEHAGCSQRSVEEAQEVLRIYQSLVGGAVAAATGRQLPGASWIDRDGVERRLTPEDVLVVAPYNLQVNLLARTLPAGARVGTVDKFQGQEAAVTLVSMTTSSEDDLPRHVEFLFSRNRLNVAISRARCLSIVLASPQLLDTRCRTPEQLALVNTLCWVAEYSLPLPLAGEGRGEGSAQPSTPRRSSERA